MPPLPKAYFVRLLNDLESSARRFIVVILGWATFTVFLLLVRHVVSLAEATLLALCSIITGYVGQGAWKEVQKAKHASAAQPAAPPPPEPPAP